jgi:branched-chain amino acid transport system ATP-binding protein
VLRIEKLSSHYGRIQALQDVSIEVGRNQLVAIVGANGAGKTTLLRAVSGVQPVSAGRILFEDEDITRMSPSDRIRAGIAQVPEGRQIFRPLSVDDNLELGTFTHRARDRARDFERVYELFPDLKAKRRLPAGTLSGGQQQMLALGRALMARPRLLVMDEPSMGLAPRLVEQVFQAVTALRDAGLTVLLVEQNAYAALQVADHGYVLETGGVVLADTATNLLHNEQVKQAYLGM